MYYVSMYLLCFAVSIGTVYSAVAILLPVEKPLEMADQEGCYVPSLDKVVPYEEPYSPQDGNSCLQFNCQRDNITKIYSCGAISTNTPGCEIVPGDKFLPYPDCCDKPACNDIDHKSTNT